MLAFGFRPWVVAVPEPPSLSHLKAKVTQAKKSGQKGPVYTLSDKNDDETSSPKYLALLELRDGDAVATSGDSEKVIEKDGKMYSHTINPQMGRLMELNPVTLAQVSFRCHWY